MIRTIHQHPHLDDSVSSENSSDLFSPIRARRTSLHQNTPDTPLHGNHDNDHNDHHHEQQQQTTLPRLHNTSWIGARVSPIPSVDEDEENDLLTAPYRRALQRSSATSSAAIRGNGGVTERSFLLPGDGDYVGGSSRGGGDIGQEQQVQIKTTIHPLWHHGTPSIQQSSSLRRKQTQNQHQHWLMPSSRLACTMIVVTGIHLACIGLHDLYFWYLSYRRNIEPKYSMAWTLPWLEPSSSRTISRFGVFIPTNVSHGNTDYWRSITSLTATTSVVEWALIAFIWGREIRVSPPPDDASPSSSIRMTIIIWLLIFVLSCWTGQLWMFAFDRDGISGCASWGTAGCACAFGVSRPKKRFELFLCAIALLLLNLFLTYNSVFGTIGGSFFGWCCHGIALVPPVPWDEKYGTMKKQSVVCKPWVATIAVVKLWTIPIFYMLWKKFWSPAGEEA